MLFNFYIIKIISPAYVEVCTNEELKQYEKSPVKEGEYYACRFNESAQLEDEISKTEQGSWILGQQLSSGQESEGFYQFCPAGGPIGPAEIIPSANEVMGCNQNNLPGNAYKLIDKFIMKGNLFRLFQDKNQMFFTIDNSPLKEVYILENLDQNKKFLIFENLRGHIKSENFVGNLKNIVLKILTNKNIRVDDLRIETIHGFEDEYKHLIKAPL